MPAHAFIASFFSLHPPLPFFLVIDCVFPISRFLPYREISFSNTAGASRLWEWLGGNHVGIHHRDIFAVARACWLPPPLLIPSAHPPVLEHVPSLRMRRTEASILRVIVSMATPLMRLTSQTDFRAGQAREGWKRRWTNRSRPAIWCQTLSPSASNRHTWRRWVWGLWGKDGGMGETKAGDKLETERKTRRKLQNYESERLFQTETDRTEINGDSDNEFWNCWHRGGVAIKKNSKFSQRVTRLFWECYWILPLFSPSPFHVPLFLPPLYSCLFCFCSC